MVIIGSKGHAKEIIEIFEEEGNTNDLFFFDNVSNEDLETLYTYPVLRNINDAKKLFLTNNKFSLGIGNPLHRENLTKQFLDIGGQFVSVISKRSILGRNAKINTGVNIMPFVTVFNNAEIGQGVLLNSFSSVHHDSKIGDFSEISPGARMLGNCSIGKLCSIGTNAVILPNVKIVDNTQIGAGAVVTKNIDLPGVYIGIPAKFYHK